MTSAPKRKNSAPLKSIASKKPSTRSAISAKTRAVVWAWAAGRCCLCNQNLIGDYLTGNEDKKFGFIAHIVAAEIDGPRGDPIRSPLLADDPKNLMLLCSVHHQLVDDVTQGYTEQDLLDIKAKHEERVRIVTGLTEDRATTVLRYGAKIGSHESNVSFVRVRTAVLPDRYPVDGKSIGIQISGNAQTDGEDAFWKTEPENLRRQFQSYLRPGIEDRTVAHLSVFALAPIPLLVELGNLLGDITPASVFQLHREPAGWRWAENGARATFKIGRPIRPGRNVALKMGVSATITDDRVHSVLGEDTAIWSLSVDNPHNDVIRYKDDLSLFRQNTRSLLNEIKANSAPGSMIHVFPAIPVSTAVELGRVRMPKADLPLMIYDQVPGSGFVPRLQIG